ncbi:general transcription factor IIF subunit 2 [Eurytemora carolleeae]|uniref:general transcription factor IIF subunit 2 n=1 Tax=Eurytemora carolleeae TaxID=1294199 RepID=UPI000C77949C|nr:general transcription factor IIF subunit 2 [Eurytemora carolleeae]|eukprot:XP_023329424.1 general transcription factor IIF subunit 2-like [Eurytemora affinis]
MAENGGKEVKEGKEGKDKSKKALDLDLTNSTRDVWLVKVPKYISDRFSKAGPNADVGKLRIRRVPGMRADVTFTLSDAICAPIVGISEEESLDLVRNSCTSQAVPKEHKFKISSIANQTMGVFSHIPGDKDAVPPVADKIQIEGKVVQRAECGPIQNKSYMNIKREAIIKAGEPRRKVMKLEKHVQNFRPVANHIANIQYDKQKKLEGKKMRDDKEKVMEILFALFEKHQYYNIKDLVGETRQPVAYLKQILNEVCNYNVKQPNKNMWELKPEFRHYKEEKEVKKKDELDDSDSD